MLTGSIYRLTISNNLWENSIHEGLIAVRACLWWGKTGQKLYRFKCDRSDAFTKLFLCFLCVKEILKYLCWHLRLNLIIFNLNYQCRSFKIYCTKRKQSLRKSESESSVNISYSFESSEISLFTDVIKHHYGQETLPVYLLNSWYVKYQVKQCVGIVILHETFILT